MRSDGDGGAMTLAFSVSAIERLADPRSAFEDARAWTEYLGVVDDDRDEVARVVEAYGLEQDFDLDDRDRWLAMEGIRETTRTPRHVYVGSAGRDRRVATQLDWEFVSVGEAAEKAGWKLSGEGSSGGLVARLKRLLSGGLAFSGSR